MYRCMASESGCACMHACAHASGPACCSQREEGTSVCCTCTHVLGLAALFLHLSPRACMLPFSLLPIPYFHCKLQLEVPLSHSCIIMRSSACHTHRTRTRGCVLQSAWQVFADDEVVMEGSDDVGGVSGWCDSVGLLLNIDNGAQYWRMLLNACGCSSITHAPQYYHALNVKFFQIVGCTAVHL